MLFSSLTFLLYFLPAVVLIHYFLPKRWQNGFLLAASLLFYAWGDVQQVPLFVVMLTAGWALGRLIERSRSRAARRWLLAAGLVLDLGTLFFYKYTGFFLETIGLDTGFSVALPLGISFFAFQAAGYLIDVYRDETPAEKSLVAFGTFLFLFPQLIAGPIMRYSDLSGALHRRRRPDAHALNTGMAYFTAGLAAKVLLANPMGAAYETLRAVPGDMLCAWLSLGSYTLQIYFDFMGYSVMAVGLGRMLGFEFRHNFHDPYSARSIKDFWRRWHITLSGWFRDYVYIPLGGSRRGRLRTVLNLLCVWCLTGLWHGADWTFVLWGLWYFVLLCAENAMPSLPKKLPAALARLLTLLCVMLGWALFVSDGLGDFLLYLGDLFSFRFASTGLFWLREYAILFAVGIAVCIPAVTGFVKRQLGKHSVLCAAAVLATMLLCLAWLANSTYNPFLYFRF